MAKDSQPPRGGTQVLSRAQLQADALSTADAPQIVPAQGAFIGMGYDDDNQLIIKDPHVSAHHCRLWRDGERLLLEDLSATNGTTVNGKRIALTEVRLGDAIVLGRYGFTLSAEIIGRLPEQSTPSSSDIQDIRRTIGRDGRPGKNDIVIDHPEVSRQHCELLYSGGFWTVKDLGSTHGTSAHTPGNRIESARLSPTDTIYLGTYPFPIRRLHDAIFGVAGQLSFSTEAAALILGRAKSCDIVIDNDQVSRKHARLCKTKSGYIIEDLGAANGLFINGQRMKRAIVGSQDVVGLGSHQLRFDFETGVVERSYGGDIMLSAEDITVRVNSGRKTILQDISLTVYPGEFVGLMGPSGAGKTTLMMALNGYLPPTQGHTRLNGVDLYRSYDAFRGNIGYVPQDDIIHSQLTVWEALYYTARLRLPPDTSRREICAIIDRVLRELEISETRDVLIGSPEDKGISGGQRKRVNLAQELITQPSLLLLDEPTSGLASEDTLNVMALLRRLADGGRTIVLTIHQPSLEAYRTMDNVVYLADGRLVYYGPTYPDSITHFNPEVRAGTPSGDRVLSDPASAMKPLAQAKREGRDMEGFAEQYKRSRLHAQYVERRGSGEASPVRISAGSKRKSRRRPGLSQWWTLTMRALTIKRKDVGGLTILLMQAPIIAGIISLVFAGQTQGWLERHHNTPMALFLLVISAIWFGCSNAAREIVGEAAIYRRERMVNLKLPSYLMSKVAVLGVLSAVQCLTLLLLTHPVLGFKGFFLEMWGILCLCSAAGMGMGLVLSSIVRTTEAAIALVPMLLIPQVILAGAIMPIHKMDPPMRVVSTTMVARWGFEAMLFSEQRGDGFEVPRSTIKEARQVRRKARKSGIESQVKHPLDSRPFPYFFGSSKTQQAVDIGVLVGFNGLMLL
jgi:ABC-type multidrug transport system ATPase subunit/predicted component of type VI protein secretion system